MVVIFHVDRAMQNLLLYSFDKELLLHWIGVHRLLMLLRGYLSFRILALAHFLSFPDDLLHLREGLVVVRPDKLYWVHDRRYRCYVAFNLDRYVVEHITPQAYSSGHGQLLGLRWLWAFVKILLLPSCHLLAFHAVSIEPQWLKVDIHVGIILDVLIILLLGLSYLG